MAWDRGAVLGRCSAALRCMCRCRDKGRSVDSFRAYCFEDVDVCFGLGMLGAWIKLIHVHCDGGSRRAGLVRG
jgi:hypothetical protein